jgi:hypothetical protein
VANLNSVCDMLFVFKFSVDMLLLFFRFNILFLHNSFAAYNLISSSLTILVAGQNRNDLKNVSLPCCTVTDKSERALPA